MDSGLPNNASKTPNLGAQKGDVEKYKECRTLSPKKVVKILSANLDDNYRISIVDARICENLADISFHHEIGSVYTTAGSYDISIDYKVKGELFRKNYKMNTVNVAKNVKDILEKLNAIQSVGYVFVKMIWLYNLGRYYARKNYYEKYPTDAPELLIYRTPETIVENIDSDKAIVIVKAYKLADGDSNFIPKMIDFVGTSRRVINANYRLEGIVVYRSDSDMEFHSENSPIIYKIFDPNTADEFGYETMDELLKALKDMFKNALNSNYKCIGIGGHDFIYCFTSREINERRNLIIDLLGKNKL